MSVLVTVIEAGALFAGAFTGARLGSRRLSPPSQIEPTAKYCQCTHVRAHHTKGAGQCWVAIGKTGSCACQKFHPDTARDLAELEKQAGVNQP